MIVSVSKLPMFSGYDPASFNSYSVPQLVQAARNAIQTTGKKVNPNKCIIVGCERCAKYCGSGGPKQVEEFARFLEANPPQYAFGGKIDVVNKRPLCGDPACADKSVHEKVDRYFAGDNAQNIGLVYVMACGGGVSCVQNTLSGLIKTPSNWPEVIPTTDTLGVGCVVNKEIHLSCTACGLCTANDGRCRMEKVFPGKLKRMSKAHPYLKRLRFMTWKDYIKRRDSAGYAP